MAGDVCKIHLTRRFDFNISVGVKLLWLSGYLNRRKLSAKNETGLPYHTCPFVVDDFVHVSHKASAQ